MKWLLPTLLMTLALGCGGEESAPVGSPSVPAEPPSADTTPVEPIPTEPAPQRVPAAVEETRQAIIAAAQARDYDALGALIPDSGFTYSYGGPAEGGAVGYWRDLEANGETPLATMAGLLILRHTRVGDLYVWPREYDKNPANLTEAQKEALAGAGAATREQLDQMAELGHYLGWRLGIRRDGTWMFFVAGD
jgi:hypothetical protein